MYTPIKMFAATLHDYAQAMLDDHCGDAKRHAAQIQRDAELMMIDPAFIRLFHERHPGVDPEPALQTLTELLDDMVEYCGRLTVTRSDPIRACRSSAR